MVSRHHRIRLRAGTEVTQLLHDDGGVTGVGVKPDRRGSPTIAGRVLLACGGFVADDELIGEHCPEATGLPVLGAPQATGDGLRLASGAGAQTRDLQRCEVTALFALPAQLEVPVSMIAQGAILVNQAGRRFADEHPPRWRSRRRCVRSPGTWPTWSSTIASPTTAGADPFVEHVVLPRAGRRGGTPLDLAKQLELNAEGFEETARRTARSRPRCGPSA